MIKGLFFFFILSRIPNNVSGKKGHGESSDKFEKKVFLFFQTKFETRRVVVISLRISEDCILSAESRVTCRARGVIFPYFYPYYADRMGKEGGLTVLSLLESKQRAQWFTC